MRTPASTSGFTAVYNGRVDNVEFATGYKYTTEVGLPTYYFGTESKGAYDIDADLRIHRLNFELGVSGPLEFHFTDPQKADYIHYESGIFY